MITFSIITCTYNAAAVLQRTLDSVATQSWHGVEHLIVDGASGDATRAMAEAYRAAAAAGASGHRVRVVSGPDKGLYDAMNKGIVLAQGDYVLFLNAGDVFPVASTLETVAGCVQAGEELPAVLYGDTDIVDDDGRFVRHRRLAPPEHLTWRSFRRGMLVCHQAFYVRTDIARVTPYDLRYRYSADVDWCIRVMREAARRRLSLRRVPVVIVNYLEGGMTEDNHRASLKERFRVMCRHYGLLSTLVMHGWFVLRMLLKK